MRSGKKIQQLGNLFKHENDVMVSFKNFNGKGFVSRNFKRNCLESEQNSKNR